MRFKGSFDDSYDRDGSFDLGMPPNQFRMPNDGIQGYNSLLQVPTPASASSDLDGFVLYICQSNPQEVGAWLMQKGAYQPNLPAGVEHVLTQGTNKDLIDFINFHPDKDMLIELYQKRQINQSCGCKPGYKCTQHAWVGGMSKDTCFYLVLLLVLALGIYFISRNNS